MVSRIGGQVFPRSRSRPPGERGEFPNETPLGLLFFLPLPVVILPSFVCLLSPLPIVLVLPQLIYGLTLGRCGLERA